MSDKPERLLIASDKLAEAARREGIEPGSPLWVWVEAQQHVLAAIYEWQTNWSAAVDTEIDQLRTALAVADTQRRRVDAEVRRMEVQQKDLETKTVASLTKAVAEKLKDALVIRERRWNRRDRHISWGAAAAAALVILLGGYTWRGVQDRFTYATAAEAWARCQDTAFMDKASGRPFCQIELTSLPPPSQRLLSR